MPEVCHFSPQDNQALRQPYIRGTIIITSITEEETGAGNNITWLEQGHTGVKSQWEGLDPGGVSLD